MAKIKNEKKVLLNFCANDGFRPVLQQPFIQEQTGDVWASDGTILLIVRPDLVRGKYKSSDCGRGLDLSGNNMNTIVQLSDIDDAYNRLDLKPEMVDYDGEPATCPHCNGEGEVEWEFTDNDGFTHYKEDTCPCCQGTGELPWKKKVETGRMIVPKGAVFSIDGTIFSVERVMKAMEGLRLLGVTSIHHTSNVKSYNIFEVQDGVRLVIMSTRADEMYPTKVRTTPGD